MRIGFSKKIITPAMGVELGGYAVKRKCNEVHDELYCKCIVLEQNDKHYVLFALDLLCVDVSLYKKIAKSLSSYGVAAENIIACAIHSHSSPRGIVLGEGELKEINKQSMPDDVLHLDYIDSVIGSVVNAYKSAASRLEPFRVRTAQLEGFNVGSERHTGEKAKSLLTVMEFLTDSNRSLVCYSFPCHPTVMGPSNLSVSADFIANVESLLHSDMAVFINSAAGDISTRFTRQESSFEECNRLAKLVADKIKMLLQELEFENATELRTAHKIIELKARKVESEETAKEKFDKLTADWEEAVQAQKDAKTIRILKSYVEGAGTNLKFAKSMKNLSKLHLPVTVFSFCGLDFISVPGELFSSLTTNEPVVFLAYANGYYRYICNKAAYENNYYEALASILEKGEGEKFITEALQLLNELKDKN